MSTKLPITANSFRIAGTTLAAMALSHFSGSPEVAKEVGIYYLGTVAGVEAMKLFAAVTPNYIAKWLDQAIDLKSSRQNDHLEKSILTAYEKAVSSLEKECFQALGMAKKPFLGPIPMSFGSDSENRIQRGILHDYFFEKLLDYFRSYERSRSFLESSSLLNFHDFLEQAFNDAALADQLRGEFTNRISTRDLITFFKENFTTFFTREFTIELKSNEKAKTEYFKILMELTLLRVGEISNDTKALKTSGEEIQGLIGELLTLAHRSDIQLQEIAQQLVDQRMLLHTIIDQIPSSREITKKLQELQLQLRQMNCWVPNLVFNADEYIISDPSNIAEYQTRYIPFMGRKEELRELYNFLDSSEMFSWWMIDGPGGMGKSRLAMEFCDLARKEGYYAGFYKLENAQLPDEDRPFGYDLPLFIVIDYATCDKDKTIKVLTYIQDKIITAQNYTQTPVKVRVLLLDRQFEKEWYDSIGYIKRSIYLFNNQLKPMRLQAGAEDLRWDIIEQVIAKEAVSAAPIPYQTLASQKAIILDKLAEIDPEKRPLFAFFAGTAVATNPTDNIRNWNKTSLLETHLNRLRNRLWFKFSGFREHRFEVEQMLVVNTLVRSLKKDEIDLFLEQNLGLKGQALEEVLDIYFQLADHHLVDGKQVYTGMQPDILGEYLILDFIERSAQRSERRTINLLGAAWALRPEQVWWTCSLLYQDFFVRPEKDISYLENLIFNSLPLNYSRDVVRYFTYLIFNINSSMIEDSARQQKYADTLIKVYQVDGQENTGLLAVIMLALINIRLDRPEEMVTNLNAARQIQSALSDNLVIARQYTMMLYKLIWRIEAAVDAGVYLAEIEQLYDAFVGDREIALQIAKSCHHISTLVISEAQSEDIIAKLTWCFDQFPQDTEICSNLVLAVYNRYVNDVDYGVMRKRYKLIINDYDYNFTRFMRRRSRPAFEMEYEPRYFNDELRALFVDFRLRNQTSLYSLVEQSAFDARVDKQDKRDVFLLAADDDEVTYALSKSLYLKAYAGYAGAEARLNAYIGRLKKLHHARQNSLVAWHLSKALLTFLETGTPGVGLTSCFDTLQHIYYEYNPDAAFALLYARALFFWVRHFKDSPAEQSEWVSLLSDHTKIFSTEKKIVLNWFACQDFFRNSYGTGWMSNYIPYAHVIYSNPWHDLDALRAVTDDAIYWITQSQPAELILLHTKWQRCLNAYATDCGIAPRLLVVLQLIAIRLQQEPDISGYEIKRKQLFEIGDWSEDDIQAHLRWYQYRIDNYRQFLQIEEQKLIIGDLGDLQRLSPDNLDILICYGDELVNLIYKVTGKESLLPFFSALGGLFPRILATGEDLYFANRFIIKVLILLSPFESKNFEGSAANAVLQFKEFRQQQVRSVELAELLLTDIRQLSDPNDAVNYLEELYAIFGTGSADNRILYKLCHALLHFSEISRNQVEREGSKTLFKRLYNAHVESGSVAGLFAKACYLLTSKSDDQAECLDYLAEIRALYQEFGTEEEVVVNLARVVYLHSSRFEWKVQWFNELEQLISVYPEIETLWECLSRCIGDHTVDLQVVEAIEPYYRQVLKIRERHPANAYIAVSLSMCTVNIAAKIPREERFGQLLNEIRFLHQLFPEQVTIGYHIALAAARKVLTLESSLEMLDFANEALSLAAQFPKHEYLHESLWACLLRVAETTDDPKICEWLIPVLIGYSEEFPIHPVLSRTFALVSFHYCDLTKFPDRDLLKTDLLLVLFEQENDVTIGNCIIIIWSVLIDESAHYELSRETVLEMLDQMGSVHAAMETNNEISFTYAETITVVMFNYDHLAELDQILVLFEKLTSLSKNHPENEAIQELWTKTDQILKDQP